MPCRSKTLACLLILLINSSEWWCPYFSILQVEQCFLKCSWHSWYIWHITQKSVTIAQERNWWQLDSLSYLKYSYQCHTCGHEYLIFGTILIDHVLFLGYKRMSQSFALLALVDAFLQLHKCWNMFNRSVPCLLLLSRHLKWQKALGKHVSIQRCMYSHIHTRTQNYSSSFSCLMHSILNNSVEIGRNQSVPLFF